MFTQNKKGQLGFISKLFSSKVLALIIIIIIGFIVYNNVIKPALEKQNVERERVFGDHMVSLDGDSCESMNVPAEGKLGYIHLTEETGTRAIYRCFKNDAEPEDEEILACEGRIDSSEILEDNSYGLGFYSLTLINSDEVTIFTQIKEENIGAAPTLTAYRKNDKVYSFIKKKDGMQYLVTVELKNENVVGENKCNIDSEKINLRPDPECSLVEGINLGAGEGDALNPFGAGADMKSICGNGMYMKSLYQKNIRETRDRLHAEDYKVLCCSETIELKK